MLDSDLEYLQRRRKECLARAESVTDPAIAEVHRRFAAEYERKLAPVGSFGAHMSGFTGHPRQQGNN